MQLDSAICAQLTGLESYVLVCTVNVHTYSLHTDQVRPYMHRCAVRTVLSYLASLSHH